MRKPEALIVFASVALLAAACGNWGQSSAPTTGKLAFSTSSLDGNGQIYAVNADGSGLTQLADEAFFGLTWSPDGKRIAFVFNRDGNHEIYVVNTDGSGLSNLTNNPAPDAQPDWSPDGARIAFVSGRDAERLPTKTPTPLSELYTPGDYAWQQVYVMNADGSNQTRLTENRSAPSGESGPAWSPDGTHIAFISSREGSNQIYIMNADGSGQTGLTDAPSGASVPLWSPDGTRIAFVAGYGPGTPGVFVMNADGSGRTGLADGSWPAWSPDGTRIVFAQGRDCGMGGGSSDIYVVNADGSGQTRLTDSDCGESRNFPAWSPDGTRIAFARGGGVSIMKPDGSNQTHLANGSVDFIAWSPVP
jgi:Tol biopolymer transport system component